MNRWFLLFICLVVGLAFLAGGLLMPVHLRATDVSVIEKAGSGGPGLVERGLARVGEKNLGAAQLILQEAVEQKLPETGKLESAVADLTKQNPELKVFGLAEPDEFGAMLKASAAQNSGEPQPFTEFVIRSDRRGKILGLLKQASNPAVQALLRFRETTNTVLFPPSQSASGQALDAAICISGLLLAENHLSKGLSDSLPALAFKANRGDSQPLEETLMDLMSLGQRFNWGQLVAFVGKIDDAETLRLEANLVRNAGSQLPAVCSIAELSGNPAAVAKYLMDFSQSGVTDLTATLRFGANGLNELLNREQRLHADHFRAPLFADWCLRMPRFALSVKWIFYLGAGFLLAMAAHFARPPMTAMERPLQVRGFHVVRELLFALGFLFVVLLLSEPFLAQESRKIELPFRLRLPMMGSAVPAGSPVQKNAMNETIVLTLLLFGVLQALLYIACLVKLAEIRRQKFPPRIKLRLLENEEHLFDAGLYLGFVGTIVSLIMVSMGVIQFSLMAAYSSTSFGIVFVVVFKIFHLRPARRKLVLEAEAAPGETVSSTAGQTFVIR